MPQGIFINFSFLLRFTPVVMRRKPTYPAQKRGGAFFKTHFIKNKLFGGQDLNFG